MDTRLFRLPLCLTALFLASTPLTPPSFAETKSKTIVMDDVKIQASRSMLDKETYPGSISVIHAEEIEKKEYIQVQDILREQLGVDVVRSGPMGGQTSLFMRGANSASTLVMIDGVQVNINTTGGFNFADLQVDNIESIEILRGPQSTMWGADATGGVINIVTKRGQGKPKHTVDIEAGSFATSKKTLSSLGELGPVDYSLSFSRTDSDGFNISNPEENNFEDDGYSNTTISNRTGFDFGENNRIEFIGRWSKAVKDLDFGRNSTTGNVADGTQQATSEAFNVSAPLQLQPLDWWRVKLTPSMNYLNTETRSFSTSTIQNRTNTVELQNNFNLGDYFTAILGGEYQEQNGSTTGSFKAETDNQGYFFQLGFQPNEQLVVTAGVRHDVHSIFGEKTTYKFEGAYRFTKWGTRLRAAYGTGFRAPTIGNLFSPGFTFGGTFFVGQNRNLVPETTESWEVGIDQELFNNRVAIGVTFFDSDIENLISTDTTRGSTDPLRFQPVNISRATSRGIETEIRVKIIDNLVWTLNHTWNDALDPTRTQLLRRPDHKLFSNLSYTRGPWYALLGLHYQKGINDTSMRSTKEYKTVRAAVSYEIIEDLRLHIRGENILNEFYNQIAGFNTPRASAYAGFTYYIN